MYKLLRRNADNRLVSFAHESLPDDFIRIYTPLQWVTINPYGAYVFSTRDTVDSFLVSYPCWTTEIWRCDVRGAKLTDRIMYPGQITLSLLEQLHSGSYHWNFTIAPPETYIVRALCLTNFLCRIEAERIHRGE